LPVKEKAMNSIYYERNHNKLFLLYFIITLVLLFQDILQQYVVVFKWADEMIGVCLIPIIFILFIAKQVKLYKEEKIIILTFSLLIITALCSSYIYKYQSMSAAISDLIIVSKFLGAYFFSRIFFYDINIRDYFKYIKIIFRVITFAVFSITVLDILFNLFPKADKRFYFSSEKLLFYHPSYLAIFCIVVLAYLTLVSENKVIDYVFIIQIMLVCASSFRAKAIGLLIVYALFLPFVKKLKKLKISYLIVATLLMVIIFIPQINNYYLNNGDSPRNILTTTSFKIANEFFPVGSGLGTYGSYISGVYYSPLYYEYNINNVWGLEKDNTSFISDTFWPMIIGQFGYLGLVIFIIILSNLFIIIKRLFNLSINYLFFALIPFIYLLISSTAESSFSNYYSVNFFIIIAMAVNQIKIYQENISNTN
jgi:hypothetical protein